jgi:hypothetical protein
MAFVFVLLRVKIQTHILRRIFAIGCQTQFQHIPAPEWKILCLSDLVRTVKSYVSERLKMYIRWVLTQTT